MTGAAAQDIANNVQALSAPGAKDDEESDFRDPYRPHGEVQDITFSRMIDRASSQLLQRCFECLYYDRVTLVKRRSVGANKSGLTYLRLDFREVMVRRIDWDNDDEVQENITIATRAVDLQYCPVLPDGSLGNIIPAHWKYPTAEDDAGQSGGSENGGSDPG